MAGELKRAKEWPIIFTKGVPEIDMEKRRLAGTILEVFVIFYKYWVL